MNYHSGCSHLLSAILQKYTNKSAHEYAKEYLFKPLGITESLWHERHKVSLGADGLRLKAIDLLKFGNLYLNQGVFNGKRIISSSWIQESTTPRFMTYPDIGHYAYHWWTSKVVVDENEIHFYFALGFGGQFIIIVPSLDVVVVFTSRIYDHSLRPMFYFKEYILTTFYE